MDSGEEGRNLPPLPVSDRVWEEALSLFKSFKVSNDILNFLSF
jgi:hypothetical protein